MSNSKHEHFDRFIDVELVNSKNKVMQITQQRYGFKPNISIAYKRVPGEFTYQASLTIGGLFMNIPTYDIQQIYVRLGYYSGSSDKSRFIRLNLTPFFSYRRNAGPDSETVFDCLIGAAEDSMLSRQPYVLTVAEDRKNTVRAVMTELLNTKELSMKPEISLLTEELLNKEWREHASKPFDTELGLISHIHMELVKLAKETRDHGVHLSIFNGKYYFMETDAEGNAIGNITVQQEGRLPVLDMTTDVTWTAGTLTVVAPFDPAIHPGSVFKCSPTIYTGNLLPNEVASLGRHKSEIDLYYVITQSVQFATKGNTNSMELLCVPYENSPMKGVLEEEQMKTRIYIDKLVDERGNDTGETVERVVSEEAARKTLSAGTLKVAKTVYITLGAEDPQNEMGSEPLTAWERGYRPKSSMDYQIYSGDTLSGLASGKFNNPTVNADSLPYFQKRIYSKTFSGASYPGFYIGYPLIALATYTRYNTDIIANKQFEIAPENPDDIKEGRYVVLPAIQNYSELNGDTTVADLLANIVSFYEDPRNAKTSWIAPTKAIEDAIRKNALID